MIVRDNTPLVHVTTEGICDRLVQRNEATLTKFGGADPQDAIGQ